MEDDRLRTEGSLDDSVGGEILGDDPDAVFDVVFVCLDVDFWLFGCLVRCRDTCEIYTQEWVSIHSGLGVIMKRTFDLTSTSLLVQALGVTLLNYTEGCINEHLDKV